MTGKHLLSISLTVDSPEIFTPIEQKLSEQLSDIRLQYHTRKHVVVKEKTPFSEEEQEELFAVTDQLVDGTTITVRNNRLTISAPIPDGFENLPVLMKPVMQPAGHRQDLSLKKNSLKNIGLALIGYHDFFNAFPGASSDHRGQHKGLSWRVHLLPFLGYRELYDRFHLDELWNSEHNKSLISKMPGVYKTPEVAEEGKTAFQVIVGEQMAFNNDKGLKISSYTDGLSNIGFVVETGPEMAAIWTRPGGLTLKNGEPVNTLGTSYSYGFLILLGDGAVRTFASDFLKGENLKAIFTRNGLELIEWPISNSTSRADRIDEPESDEADLHRVGKDNRKEQLRQIGLALHNYHAAYNAFPASGSDHSGKQKGLSWRVHLLLFVGEGALYYQFHLDEPWDSQHNKTLISRIPEVYIAPGVTEKGNTAFQVVIGANTAFEAEKGLRMRDITDGLSNTAFVVETRPDKSDIWTKPGGLTLDDEEPIQSLGKPSTDGFLILMGDGAVKTINGELLRADTLKALFTRNGREVIPSL